MSARLHQVRLSPSWPKWHLIASSAAWLLAILLISSPGAAYLESWTPQQVFGLYDCSGPAWFIDPSTGHDNLPPSLRSGPVQTVGKSRLCRNVTAPASISWWWKAEGDGQRLGQLRFLVDGEVKYVCSSHDWSYATYTVRDEGEHAVSWEYYKIKSYPEYAGAGWIDDLSIESQAPWVPPVLPSDQTVMGEQVENRTHIINLGNISTIDMAATPKGVNIFNFNISLNPENLIDDLNITLRPEDIIDNINISLTPDSLIGNMNITFKPDDVINNLNIAIGSEGDSTRQKDTIIELIYPKNNEMFQYNMPIEFKSRQINGARRFDNCNLYIDGQHKINLSRINENDHAITQSFNKSDEGVHTWYVSCCCNEVQCIMSDERSFEIKLPPCSIINVTEEVNVSTNNFTSIEDALRNITDGGTIYVYKREIEEKIVIERPVNITGIDNPTLKIAEESEPVINIMSDNVSIHGLNITGTPDIFKESETSKIYDTTETGIYCCNVRGIYINHTNIDEVANGIKMDGCTQINISDCKIHFNVCAIDVTNTNGATDKYNYLNINFNKLEGFDVSRKERYGIRLRNYTGEVYITNNYICTCYCCYNINDMGCVKYENNTCIDKQLESC